MFSEGTRSFKTGKQPEHSTAGRRESSRLRSSWLLHRTPELANCASGSPRPLVCSRGRHTNLQITPRHTGGAARTGIAPQETTASWWHRELLSKTIIKTRSERAMRTAKRHHFVDDPRSKPAAGYRCFRALTPKAHFPSGNPQPELRQLSRAPINSHGNSGLPHDHANRKLWKKIIRNHLKMAARCHCSNRLFATSVTMIQ